MTLSKETQAKLEDFLKAELVTVYCDTCSGENTAEGDEDYFCDDCHRKNMYWSISNETVRRIITEISETLEEQEKKLEDEQ